MTSLTSAVPELHRLEQARRPGSEARGGAGGPLVLPLVDLTTAAVVSGITALATMRSGARPDLDAPLVLLVAWFAALAGAGAWTRRRRSSLRPVLRAGVVVALTCWVAGDLVAPQLATPVQGILVTGLVAVAAASRLLVAAPAVRVAVTGDLAQVRGLAAELRRDRRQRWDVTAVCVAPDEPLALSPDIDADLSSVPLWVGVDAVVDAARATGAGAVLVLPGSAIDPSAVRRIGWTAHAAGLDVLVGTGLLDVHPSRVQHLSAGLAGLARVRPRTSASASLAAKHAADRLLACLALLLFLPLLVAIAVAVRCDSPGGALYAQRRTGRGGTTFTMWKFRTMRSGADQLVRNLADQNECDGVLFKMREDPRITRVGRILRRYSLDELPQLINVARGEMSLVGPRPALPTEVARYETDPRHRLTVKPGLTGLWQVSGRSDLSWEDAVRLDLHYVDNWSWALDLRILARTVGAVLGHRGAY